MTNEQVQATYIKAVAMVKSEGFTPMGILNSTVEFNRSKKAYGYCKTRINNRTGELFSKIYISRYFAENAKEQDMLNTLCHEVLHSCMVYDKHGKSWKKAADIMNRKYGLNIQRCNNYTDENGEVIFKNDSVAKYELKCPKCGKTFYYNRMCKAVKNPQNFVHTGCNVGLIRTK